jgi:hypothetical protein
MAPGTSPAIAVTGETSYMAVFQANTNTLWSAGAGTPDNWGLAMAPGTSPAIIALPDRGSLSGGEEVAYQGSNGDLWVATQNADNGDWTGVDQGLGMMAGTSPAITAYYPCSICRNQ